jgi:hypothetical protein
MAKVDGKPTIVYLNPEVVCANNSHTISISTFQKPSIEYMERGSLPLSQLPQLIMRKMRSNRTGNCIVFLPSLLSVQEAREILEKDLRDSGITVYSIPFTQDTTPQQDSNNMVVLCTSHTQIRGLIANVICVVDYGYNIIESFDHRGYGFTKRQKLAISTLESRLRRNCVSSDEGGVCIRIYSEMAYRTFVDSPPPENQICHPFLLLLKLETYGFDLRLVESLTRLTERHTIEKYKTFYTLLGLDKHHHSNKASLLDLVEYLNCSVEWAFAIWISVHNECHNQVVIAFALMHVLGEYEVVSVDDVCKIQYHLDPGGEIHKLLDSQRHFSQLKATSQLGNPVMKRWLEDVDKVIQSVSTFIKSFGPLKQHMTTVRSIEECLMLAFFRSIVVLNKENERFFPIFEGSDVRTLVSHQLHFMVAPGIQYVDGHWITSCTALLKLSSIIRHPTMMKAVQMYARLSLVKEVVDLLHKTFSTDMVTGSSDLFEQTFRNHRVCLDEFGVVTNVCDSRGYLSLIMEGSASSSCIYNGLTLCEDYNCLKVIPLPSDDGQLRARVVFDTSRDALYAYDELERFRDFNFNVQPGAPNPSFSVHTRGYYCKFYQKGNDSIGKAEVTYSYAKQALAAAARAQDTIVRGKRLTVLLKPPKSIRILNLPYSYDEEDVYKLFRRYGLICSIVVIRRHIQRDNTCLTGRWSLNEHLLDPYLTGMRGVSIYSFEKNGVTVRFRRLDDLVDVLHRANWVTRNSYSIRAVKFYVVSFKILSRVLKTIQKSLEAILHSIEDERIYGMSITSEMRTKHTFLLVQTPYLADLQYVQGKLLQLLEGELLFQDLNGRQLENIFDPTVSGRIQEIADRNNCYLEMSRHNRMVRVIGDGLGRQCFEEDLQRFILSFPGLFELGRETSGPPREDTCPVCLCTVHPGRAYTLPRCRHVYCWGCLAHLMETTIAENQLPITCCQCNTPIVYRHVRRILSISKLELLLERGLDALVRDHPDSFRRCPVRSCQHILKVPTSQKRARPSLHTECTYCHSIICNGCWKECHPGQTCREFAISESAEDSATQSWKAEHTKSCGYCGASIEKVDGCDHVVCFVCKGDMCWACGSMFDSSQACYSHINRIHN